MNIIKKSWQTVKANILAFVGAAVILLLINTLFNVVTSFTEKNTVSFSSTVLIFTTTFVSLIITTYVMAALIRIARGAVVTLQVLSVSASQILRFLGVNIIIGLIMFVLAIPFFGGVAFFAVEGLSIAKMGDDMSSSINILVAAAIFIVAFLFILYISIRFMFAEYLVLDSDAGIFEAIKRSWMLTSGNVWTIVKLGLLSLLIVLLGVLALVVGLALAIPVVALAYAYLYIELCAQKEKLSLDTKKNE